MKFFDWLVAAIKKLLSKGEDKSPPPPEEPINDDPKCDLQCRNGNHFRKNTGQATWRKRVIVARAANGEYPRCIQYNDARIDPAKGKPIGEVTVWKDLGYKSAEPVTFDIGYAPVIDKLIVWYEP